MTWEELKEKAKELGYANNALNCIWKDFIEFYKDGTVNCVYEEKRCTSVITFSENRNYEQMLMIMEALKWKKDYTL